MSYQTKPSYLNYYFPFLPYERIYETSLNNSTTQLKRCFGRNALKEFLVSDVVNLHRVPLDESDPNEGLLLFAVSFMIVATLNYKVLFWSQAETFNANEAWWSEESAVWTSFLVGKRYIIHVDPSELGSAHIGFIYVLAERRSKKGKNS